MVVGGGGGRCGGVIQTLVPDTVNKMTKVFFKPLIQCEISLALNVVTQIFSKALIKMSNNADLEWCDVSIPHGINVMYIITLALQPTY